MKIGIDARFYGPFGGGGLGRYTKELVDNLEQIDDTNQYVIFLRRENWDDYNPAHKNFRKVLAPYQWYSWREQIFMPFKIWREKLDLMHFLHFNVPLIYSLSPLFSKGDKGGFKECKMDVKDLKPPLPPFKKGGIISGVFFRKHNFILTIHDLILLKYPSKKATTLAPIYFKLKFWMYKLVMRSALRRARKIIVPSEFVKKDIIKYFNIRPEKIEVVYEGAVKIDKENGFGENRFVEHRIRNYESGIMNYEFPPKALRPLMAGDQPLAEGIMNGKEGGRYILYVGNAYPHKNLERLIDMFAMIARNSEEGKDWKEGGEGKDAESVGEGKLEISAKGGNLRLVLVGMKNYFYEQLEEYVKNNFPEIKDKIIFFGYATDKELAELYRNAALYVFPSLDEGFGLPPLEAMSYGAPVVSSDKSCLPEILGDAVLYFDANDARDMADKILRGLENEKLRNDLIKRGYERIKLYNWEENARRTMEIYNKN